MKLKEKDIRLIKMATWGILEDITVQHSLKISILFYVFGCFYMVFGAYITASSVKSYTNRLFVFMTSTLAIWAFAYSIGNSAPTPEAGAFWLSVAVLGWGVFYSVFFHFILILTGTPLLVKKWMAHALIYIPSIINVILFAPFGVLKDQQYLLVQSDFGWINTMPLTPGDIWFMIYYAAFSISSLVFLIRWRIKIDPKDPLKKHATYVLISAHIPLVLGVLTETVPSLFGIISFPKLAVTFMIAPVLTLFSTLKKINLIVKREREKIVSRESKELLEKDRLRLFQIVAAVYTAGSAITFLIRYFGINMSLKQELFVSALFLATGIVLRLVPYVTKNHSIQNTIFLVISTSSVLFFLRLNAATGALTIWSVYILFLLFTVVLDSKIHAVIFTVFMVIIQIAFWIINPRVPVTIDGNEYLSRIAIIIISYFAVKYLTNEYASKIDAYKDFAIEQEVLERISSTFISVNKENVQKKVQEMMKMSGEVLKFNHAYLIGFSEDYKDANVFAAYSMDPEGHKSRPYHPGMKLKTASLPVVSTMIAERAPVICNDLENDRSYECIESKNLLLSRGIHSFYALPLAMEENEHLDGILVIENYNRSNENLKENRSYFLSMLVNMLRDTRKKTLYEEQLYSSAYFDETTKLANRNMVIKKLYQRIHEIKGSERIAILDIELENLRMIKDTFGHGLGEQILVKSAAVLKEILGDKCEISRLGEGEFGLVLPDMESHVQVQECADKIVSAFSTPIFTDTGVE